MQNQTSQNILNNKLQITQDYINKGMIPILVNYKEIKYFDEHKKAKIFNKKSPRFPDWTNTKLEDAYKKIHDQLLSNNQYNIGILPVEP